MKKIFYFSILLLSIMCLLFNFIGTEEYNQSSFRFFINVSFAFSFLFGIIGLFTSTISIIESMFSQEISIILKKIDTRYFKSIYMSILLTKDKEDIVQSLDIIKNINKENPEWFISNLRKEIKLKNYLLSKKSFIEYLSSFDNKTIEKYFKEDIESLKYNYNQISDYYYFKELIENRFNKKNIQIEQKIKILSI